MARPVLSQAMYELNKGHPDIAMRYIEVGLKSKPTHADLLLIKGKCCVVLNRFRLSHSTYSNVACYNFIKMQEFIPLYIHREALQIAEKVYSMRRRGSSLALSLEDQNAIILTVKGDALFSLGNSEHALLSYHRAARIAQTKASLSLCIIHHYCIEFIITHTFSKA